MTRRLFMAAVAVIVFSNMAQAQRRRYVQPQYTPQKIVPQNQKNTVGLNESSDALDEVNMKRAARGLHPFIKDAGLTKAAYACAKFRAARLMFGHTNNDMDFLPPGVTAQSAGCAAYPDEYGWMSCCALESYTYAGAAWVRGSDGKRHMHIFVR